MYKYFVKPPEHFLLFYFYLSEKDIFPYLRNTEPSFLEEMSSFLTKELDHSYIKWLLYYPNGQSVKLFLRENIVVKKALDKDTKH